MSGLPVPGRSAPGGVLTPPSRPHAVIAGAPRSGKSSLVNALIEAPGCTPVDMAATAAAWLVFRHGERPAARAFIPGHREPRPIGLNGRRLGENAVSGREGQSRPPRRIEISYPADLLTHLSLVDTPGVDEFDIAAGEVVLDAAGRGCGLIFVFDAAAPLTRVQLDLLSSAMQRVRCVALVLTKIDRYDEWPDVLAANRASLVATGDWPAHPGSRSPSIPSPGSSGSRSCVTCSPRGQPTGPLRHPRRSVAWPRPPFPAATSGGRPCWTGRY